MRTYTNYNYSKNLADALYGDYQNSHFINQEYALEAIHFEAQDSRDIRIILELRSLGEPLALEALPNEPIFWRLENEDVITQISGSKMTITHCNFQFSL